MPLCTHEIRGPDENQQSVCVCLPLHVSGYGGVSRPDRSLEIYLVRCLLPSVSTTYTRVIWWSARSPDIFLLRRLLSSASTTCTSVSARFYFPFLGSTWVNFIFGMHMTPGAIFTCLCKPVSTCASLKTTFSNI